MSERATDQAPHTPAPATRAADGGASSERSESTEVAGPFAVIDDGDVTAVAAAARRVGPFARELFFQQLQQRRGNFFAAQVEGTLAAEPQRQKFDATAEASGPDPFEFALQGGSVDAVAALLVEHADRSAELARRARAARGRRFEFEVLKQVAQTTGQLGGFELRGAVAALGSRSKATSHRVIAHLLATEPEHQAALVGALLDAGVLDDLLAPLPFAQVEALHDHLLGHEATRTTSGQALAAMRHYFAYQDRTDHSLSRYLGGVPLIGDGLTFAGNVATFGFLGEHDAAYRQERAGLITEDDYWDATKRAGAKAGVVGAVSLATGGAAGAYTQGATAPLAATGAAGRVAAAGLVGVSSGAAGGIGAQAGSDLVDRELSDPGDYALAATLGGVTGGALGAGGGALVESLPAASQAWLASRMARFPESFAGFRAMGERHALTLQAGRLQELLADGAATLATPELAAATAGLAPEVRVRVSAELDPRGLRILEARRLPDGDGFADGPGDSGSLFDDHGPRASYADRADDWRPVQEGPDRKVGGELDDDLTVVDHLPGDEDHARPSWQDSERRVTDDLDWADFSDQASFLRGQEVRRGTPGSTRPDNYSKSYRLSVDVKNYRLRLPEQRRAFMNDVLDQVRSRAQHLPPRSRQSIVVDTRGQTVDAATLEQMRATLVRRSNGALQADDIVFLSE